MPPHIVQKQKVVFDNKKKFPIPSSVQKRKLYKIVWFDAFASPDQWLDEETLELKDYICETVGFLIKKNGSPHYYTLASTITLDGYFCSVMNIPKSWVISKTQL